MSVCEGGGEHQGKSHCIAGLGPILGEVLEVKEKAVGKKEMGTAGGEGRAMGFARQ